MTNTDGRRRPFVCMIAYTDYVFDARVRREAETLAAAGYRVMCLKNRDGAGPPQRCVLNGVEIRDIDVPKYQGKNAVAYLGSYLRFLLAASAICAGFAARRELDVVHVHNLPDFLVFAALVPRLAGSKVVLDVHDSLPETFATKFSNASAVWKALCWEERLSASVAHRVICVNHPQQQTLVSRGLPLSKTFVSMNVPDPSIFSSTAAQRRPTKTGGTFDIVYHGTMAERLGVDLIIRAVAALRQRIPCLRLHLWGRGDDYSNFRMLANDLGVEDHVQFKPEGYPLEQLPERLQAMDLGVVGNRQSVATKLMLPVKLIEYVSLGIPAVAPRLPTIEHYFTDDMVAFYEAESVNGLADTIYRLSSAPEQRERQADHARRFLTEHGWERQGPELVAFYNRLMES